MELIGVVWLVTEEYPLAEAAIFGEDPVLGLAEPGLGTRQLNQKSHRQQNPPRATMPRQRPPRP